MTAAAAALGALRRGEAANAAPVGAQLYTVRNLMPKDADGTLKALADIGFRQVEGDRIGLVALQPLLKKHKLATPSCMIETPLVTGSWAMWKIADPNIKKAAEWDEALDSVKSLGAHWAVLAYLLPGERPKNADGFKKLADSMNDAGARCAKAGLQFAYHNHAFEFGGQPGQRLIDVLLERLDPKLVKLEVDVFWVSTTGNDPAEFIRRNAARVELVHLKDKKAGSPVHYGEDVKPESFVELGSGSIDIPAVLKAASAAGVKQYFIEQDATVVTGDPLASLRKSYGYLKSLKSPALALS